MKDRRCRYCRQAFTPNRYHPEQRVCNKPACQCQRRADYHRQKIASDPVYQTRADPSVKLEALESVVPPKLRSRRFKATDKLIASLRATPFMPSKKPSK